MRVAVIPCEQDGFPQAGEVLIANELSGELFIRRGECTNCGECCHGCPLFAGDRCTDRESETYAAGCWQWPSHPSQIADKPGCTYSFEAI